MKVEQQRKYLNILSAFCVFLMGWLVMSCVGAEPLWY